MFAGMVRRFALVFLLFSLVFTAAAPAKDRFQAPGAVHLDRDGEKWVEKTLKHLSLEQKVGQMIVISAEAEFMNPASAEAVKLRDQIRKYHLGGIVLTVKYQDGFLYRNQPYEAAAWTNALQRDAELPLIFAADFERGLSMRLQGATTWPHAMAFGADGKVADAEAFGRIVALESRAIGVHWNFFPVADVNSNPDNPIINTRSFGEDPQQVSAMVAAYIRGSRAGGMLTTAKHFPGHGDTATDSHLALAIVPGDRQRLESVELPPFRDAIAAGVDSIMVAHVTVPALDSDANRVATTSPAVVTDLLKQQLGFHGLVVTDALDMRGLTRHYAGPGGVDNGRAAVEAVKAGNDVVLHPGNVGAAFDALVAAVRSGEIPMARIDEAVRKILRAKASVGLHRARFVDLNALATSIARPENIAAAQQVADDAVTLVRDNGRVLPLKKTGTAAPRPAYGEVREPGTRTFALVLTDDVRSEQGRVLAHELKARVPDAAIMQSDPRLAPLMAPQIIAAADRAESVIVAAYITPVSGKVVKVNGGYENSVSLDPAVAALLHDLLRRNAAKTAMIAVGSPYLGRSFPEVQTYLCTFSNSTVSELSAVKALFGEINIRGHLPVTIPDFAARGMGIERAALSASGASHDVAGNNSTR